MPPLHGEGNRNDTSALTALTTMKAAATYTTTGRRGGILFVTGQERSGGSGDHQRVQASHVWKSHLTDGVRRVRLN